MSGPLPTFAATAVFGRRSSQPSLSMSTWTPYCAMNFLVFSANRRSSPSTNFDGRSTFRAAPFSMSNLGAGTSAAGTSASAPPARSSVAPASAPAPARSVSRRVRRFMT